MEILNIDINTVIKIKCAMFVGYSVSEIAEYFDISEREVYRTICYGMEE